jgi:carboxypeptidase C (cathepsin A)
MARFTQLAAILAAATIATARKPFIKERQLPANATGITTITSAQGAQIRYKQPGKAGVCETTEGVDDYAGYISLNPTTNMFFWFFEARENPSEKPLVSSRCPSSDVYLTAIDIMAERRAR